MSNLATFGETMLRMSPQDPSDRLADASHFRVDPGGSESNVAIGLAMLGHHVFHLTRLPNNPMGDLIVNRLRQYGVDVSRVRRGGQRVGCYWTETGIGPRPSRVIYDREDSAFSLWQTSQEDWETLLSKVDRLHVSGITPAISQAAADTLLSVLEAAPESMNISMDLNYRGTLWRYVKGDLQSYVRERMAEYAKQCDVLLGNEMDFQQSLGFTIGDSPDVVDQYRAIAEEAFARYSRLRHVAISLRESSSATENIWSGALFVRTQSGIQSYQGRRFELRHIVDRVGSGDSFAAGILHGLLSFPGAPQRILDFAVTLSALNHTIRGDTGQFGEDEVWQVLESQGTGRIIR